MSLLEKYYKMVEGGIERLGVNPKTCRTDEPNKWYLHRGDADVVVFVRESMMYNDTKKFTLVMVSPLLRLPQNPEKRMALLTHAMNTNHQFINERFSSDSDVLYMSSTIFLDDTNDASISMLLDSMSFYAQAFGNEFATLYGEEVAN